tara:strand:+ start:132 stop:818 length:687 start_codon:yes stop_codon:yes gene_type:complete
LAKRLSPREKNEIIQSFTEGNSLDFISRKFERAKLTIIRSLKKDLGDKKYIELNNKIKFQKENIFFAENQNDETVTSELNNTPSNEELVEIQNLSKNHNESTLISESSFLEITPLLDYEIEDESRKDLSSIPISDVDLPKIVYMIVDKNIELIIKLLKDYSDWCFLPEDDLNRKTIEIYLDLKIAKRFCSKDQKVIKVPNTNVFRITAPLLKSRGISRIISVDKLISL